MREYRSPIKKNKNTINPKGDLNYELLRSKSTSRYVFLENNGEKLTKAFTLQNSHQHFQDLLSRLQKLNISADNLITGIEATGIWWENLYTFLTENGFKTIVLNPHQTN